MSNSRIVTSCKECVFKVCDSRRIQTGCKLDRLDKFKKLTRTKEIVGANNDAWYEINRLCTTCRNQRWADNVNKGITLREAVTEEASPTFYVIVVFEQNNTLTQLAQTIKELKNNKHFHRIILCVAHNSDNVPFNQLYDYVRHYPSVSVEQIIPNDDGTRPNRARVVDICVRSKYCINPYYVILQPGLEIGEHFDKLYNSLFYALNQFLMVLPGDPIGHLAHLLTIHTKLHRIISGSAGEYNVVDKIMILAEEKDALYLVVRREDL